MKLRVEVLRQIEVETSDPIFQELYWTHVNNGVAAYEKNTDIPIFVEW